MRNGDHPIVLAIDFEGEVIEWRGPAPFMFVTVPEEFSGEIRYAAHEASYSWGVVPVEARSGDVHFTTSLFPRNGVYLLPIKALVQKETGVCFGDRIAISLCVRGR